MAAAVSATLIAAGCSNAPGVVAYVGDQEITTKQLTTAVDAVTTTVQAGQTVSSEAVINAMIQGELSAQIATEKNITITDTQRVAFLKTTNLQPLLSVPAALPVIYDVADQEIVAKQLGPAPYLAEVAKRSVKLNPRYGVLDPQQKIIVTDASGSLSVADPSAVQTP